MGAAPEQHINIHLARSNEETLGIALGYYGVAMGEAYS